MQYIKQMYRSAHHQGAQYTRARNAGCIAQGIYCNQYVIPIYFMCT